MRKSQNDMGRFHKMGLAAMLPGMQYMLELMEKQIAEIRAVLNGVSPDLEDESREAPPATITKLLADGKVQRRQYAKRIKAGSYWDNMTPEQRKAEMARRLAMRNPIKTPEGYLTTRAAGDVLKVNTVTMRRWMDTYKMKFKTAPQGNRIMYFIYASDVQKLADKRRAQA